MYKFMNLSKLNAEPGAAGGSGGGTGGQGGSEAKFTQADIDRIVAEQVAGLKAKNSELLGSQKELKEKLAKFDGIDPEAVSKLMKQFENDEEMKMIAEGKYQDVINKRVEKVNEAKQREIEALTKNHQDEMTKTQSALDRYAALVLENAIRAEAQKAGVTFGVEDAVLRAKLTFKLDDGLVVPLDENNFGADGKPLTLKEWFDGMKEKAPHWFPASQGGGSHGGTAGGGKSMTREQFEKLSPTEKSKAMADGIQLV
ncbi:hypothetical protein DPW02_11575 [Aggregatibacter aphrophilus]|jgi:hypothetical protein|nr:hypothetical protein DPW02_11575 [Aggregatibacter aphrophilus]DAM33203.1 MAG TPA: minor structural protein [Caudoviricetes sp.]DAO82416.1 MAG TPA: minor structural protein [Caudoviricetes sp.]